MDEDYPTKDLMIYTVSPVRRCSEFRRHALKGREHDEEPKQHVADSVMAAHAGAARPHGEGPRAAPGRSRPSPGETVHVPRT